MGSRAREGRPLRGDRADGQGVRQPRRGSSCSTCSPRRRATSTSSRAPAASRPRTPRSTCRRCTRPGWSRARARAPACATRSPATRRSRCGSRCATPPSPQLAEVERAARDYLGDEVDAIGRDELRRAAAQGRRRARRRPPGRGVRGRAHRGRALDPDRRARGPAGRAAGRPRGRGLLPRPVLRLRPRGRPPPAGRRPAGAAPRGGLAGMAARPSKRTRRARERAGCART